MSFWNTLKKQSELFHKKDDVDPTLYDQHYVKRGLRDKNGNGVVAGLTHVSEINAFKMVDGEKTPCRGELFYRGIDVKTLIQGFSADNRYGFEETAYLLLFGVLPSPAELEEFQTILAECRALHTNFTRDVIMKSPNEDIMSAITKSVLSLAYYDKNLNDLSLPNVLRQCLKLISVFPMLAVYGYNAYNHYSKCESLVIHPVDKKLSTAENILRMLRPNKRYTPLEAKVLDAALILHMEHGGGNNSTFTTRVVTSAGSDTYSTMAAALSSLKGPIEIFSVPPTFTIQNPVTGFSPYRFGEPVLQAEYGVQEHFCVFRCVITVHSGQDGSQYKRVMPEDFATDAVFIITGVQILVIVQLLLQIRFQCGIDRFCFPHIFLCTGVSSHPETAGSSL